MDSMSTQDIPAWGYGLRYQYGIFEQLIGKNGEQVEVPDPWLDHSNAWEVPRLDNAVEIRFYGEAERAPDGKGPGKWTGGMQVLAVPYDFPIPGFQTNNTNNIRLWSSKPKRSFDLTSFNQGDYSKAIKESNEAELITRVLYPADNTNEGKELRLKQQYFWCAASLQDVCVSNYNLGIAADPCCADCATLQEIAKALDCLRSEFDVLKYSASLMDVAGLQRNCKPNR